MESRSTPLRIVSQSVDQKIKMLDQQKQKIQEMRETEKKIRNQLMMLELDYETAKNIVKQQQKSTKENELLTQRDSKQSRVPFSNILTDYQTTNETVESLTERIPTNFVFSTKNQSQDQSPKYPDVLIQKRKKEGSVPASGNKINQHSFNPEDYDIQRYFKGKNVGFKSTRELIG